jgi:hypothetical protein
MKLDAPSNLVLRHAARKCRPRLSQWQLDVLSLGPPIFALITLLAPLRHTVRDLFPAQKIIYKS